MKRRRRTYKRRNDESGVCEWRRVCDLASAECFRVSTKCARARGRVYEKQLEIWR